MSINQNINPDNMKCKLSDAYYMVKQFFLTYGQFSYLSILRDLFLSENEKSLHLYNCDYPVSKLPPCNIELCVLLLCQNPKYKEKLKAILNEYKISDEFIANILADAINNKHHNINYLFNIFPLSPIIGNKIFKKVDYRAHIDSEFYEDDVFLSLVQKDKDESSIEKYLPNLGIQFNSSDIIVGEYVFNSVFIPRIYNSSSRHKFGKFIYDYNKNNNKSLLTLSNSTIDKVFKNQLSNGDKDILASINNVTNISERPELIIDILLQHLKDYNYNTYSLRILNIVIYTIANIIGIENIDNVKGKFKYYLNNLLANTRRDIDINLTASLKQIYDISLYKLVPAEELMIMWSKIVENYEINKFDALFESIYFNKENKSHALNSESCLAGKNYVPIHSDDPEELFKYKDYSYEHKRREILDKKDLYNNQMLLAASRNFSYVEKLDKLGVELKRDKDKVEKFYNGLFPVIHASNNSLLCNHNMSEISKNITLLNKQNDYEKIFWPKLLPILKKYPLTSKLLDDNLSILLCHPEIYRLILNTFSKYKTKETIKNMYEKAIETDNWLFVKDMHENGFKLKKEYFTYESSYNKLIDNFYEKYMLFLLKQNLFIYEEDSKNNNIDLQFLIEFIYKNPPTANIRDKILYHFSKVEDAQKMIKCLLNDYNTSGAKYHLIINSLFEILAKAKKWEYLKKIFEENDWLSIRRTKSIDQIAEYIISDIKKILKDKEMLRIIIYYINLDNKLIVPIILASTENKNHLKSVLSLLDNNKRDFTFDKESITKLVHTFYNNNLVDELELVIDNSVSRSIRDFRIEQVSYLIDNGTYEDLKKVLKKCSDFSAFYNRVFDIIVENSDIDLFRYLANQHNVCNPKSDEDFWSRKTDILIDLDNMVLPKILSICADKLLPHKYGIFSKMYGLWMSATSLSMDNIIDNSNIFLKLIPSLQEARLIRHKSKSKSNINDKTIPHDLHLLEKLFLSSSDFKPDDDKRAEYIVGVARKFISAIKPRAVDFHNLAVKLVNEYSDRICSILLPAIPDTFKNSTAKYVLNYSARIDKVDLLSKILTYKNNFSKDDIKSAFFKAAAGEAIGTAKILLHYPCDEMTLNCKENPISKNQDILKKALTIASTHNSTSVGNLILDFISPNGVVNIDNSFIKACDNQHYLFIDLMLKRGFLPSDNTTTLNKLYRLFLSSWENNSNIKLPIKIIKNKLDYNESFKDWLYSKCILGNYNAFHNSGELHYILSEDNWINIVENIFKKNYFGSQANELLIALNILCNDNIIKKPKNIDNIFNYLKKYSNDYNPEKFLIKYSKYFANYVEKLVNGSDFNDAEVQKSISMLLQHISIDRKVAYQGMSKAGGKGISNVDLFEKFAKQYVADKKDVYAPKLYKKIRYNRGLITSYFKSGLKLNNKEIYYALLNSKNNPEIFKIIYKNYNDYSTLHQILMEICCNERKPYSSIVALLLDDLDHITTPNLEKVFKQAARFIYSDKSPFMTDLIKKAYDKFYNLPEKIATIVIRYAAYPKVNNPTFINMLKIEDIPCSEIKKTYDSIPGFFGYYSGCCPNYPNYYTEYSNLKKTLYTLKNTCS